jgi:hypothetical protein
MKLVAIATAYLALATAYLDLAGGSSHYDRAEVLKALRIVECGDADKPPRGDGGAARGHYQIWKVYWYDAVEFSGIGGTYAQVETDKAYAGKVVAAYMERYAKKEWERIEAGTATLSDVETVARIHNGGPRGAKGKRRKLTDGYWAKVKKEITNAKS